jgi:hypothetical protein
MSTGRPDCVEVGPAPPSGVHFETDDVTNVGREGVHDGVEGVPVMRLATLALTSPALTIYGSGDAVRH